MKGAPLVALLENVFKEIASQIPSFQNSPEDWNISQGNVAMCVITESGKVYGKLFGKDKLKQRGFYSVAWKKASQVWITGHATGAYEKIVFGGSMDPEASPIALPELIGWVGGQPYTLKNGTQLSIGFSGFRGFNDIQIVKDAFAKIDVN
jgi:glc operon protein GlcG